MIIDKLEEICLKILEKIGLKIISNYYRKHQEGMRYLVFGALTTVLNFMVYLLVSKIFEFSGFISEKVICGFKISIILSNSIAWITAVIFAYITNKIWVFKSKTKGRKQLIKEITSFFCARLFTFVIETIFLNLFVYKLKLNEYIMKIISNILVILMNFVFSKIFIFKKKEEK